MKKVITIISCCIIIFSIGGCMNEKSNPPAMLGRIE